MELSNPAFSLFGKSGKKYEFHQIYQLSELSHVEFDKDFGIIYIYLFINTNSIQLVYCGKDENPPKRLKEHEKYDKNIVNNSNFVAIAFYMYKDDMIKDEIDLLEGNDFEENIQHNL